MGGLEKERREKRGGSQLKILKSQQDGEELPSQDLEEAGNRDVTPASFPWGYLLISEYSKAWRQRGEGDEVDKGPNQPPMFLSGTPEHCEDEIGRPPGTG